MSNLGRILRIALGYRWTVIGAGLCAVAVALLWVANLGTIYPVVEVAFQRDSLQGWVARKIEDAQQGAAEKAAEIQQLEAELPEADDQQREVLEVKIGRAKRRVAAEQQAEARYRWLQPYVNRYLPSTAFPTMALVVGFLLFGTVIKDLFLIANTVLVARIAQLTTYDLRNTFYRRTLRMDLGAFDRDGTADLMSRFTHDLGQVSAGLDVMFGKLVREPFKAIACLIGAACISWQLLLLSLLLAPVGALLIRWLARTLKRANRRAMEEMAQIYTSLEETFRAIKIVKAFTSERRERVRFHGRNKQYFHKAMRIARYNSLIRPINEVMGILTICMALLAGTWLVVNKETHLFGIPMCPRPMDFSELILFYALLTGTADPVRKLSEVFGRVQRTAAAADRIYERFDREPKILDPPHPVPLERHHRELVFDRVGFAYQPDRPALEDIDLRIPFGQTVAVVGPNGCGKSTLTNLIPRFYDPTAGEIRIDGSPLRDVRIRDLRRQIGLVTQEVVLLDDTILNNIRYGSPRATEAQAIEAARRAQAHDFIENETPDGYQTMVGSMGCRLSGGQRQRIALARAILRDPPIIILDEATSQIDLESERAIQQVLEEFVRDRTAVMVTHRMSVLALADQIVVMQAGRILDLGTHEELLARCGLYRRLHQIQFGQADGAADAIAA